tara:strand:+ start:195 stop:629 length:435 start_codon:yes stop_codon:yes gene_type:complete
MVKAKIKNTSLKNDTYRGNKMATKPANAAQKKWMSDIVDWAVCNLGLLYGDKYDGAIPQLHHVLGRSAKHNKVAIGHWFVLPVPFELHDVSSNHHFNVTHCKNNFTNQFGSQRDLFQKMVISMIYLGYRIPSPEIVYSILDTRA